MHSPRVQPVSRQATFVPEQGDSLEERSSTAVIVVDDENG
jgi:hypothetical protein